CKGRLRSLPKQKAPPAAGAPTRDSKHGSWEVAWWLRLRQRLARKHFVAVGGHVDERGDDDGHLLHVGFLDAFVNVHVGMMGARIVVQGILDELKAGQAN